MGTKAGFFIIVTAVVIMMGAMVQLVIRFQEETEMTKITHEAALDSITNARFDEVLYSDSILIQKIEDQQQQIEALKTQLTNIRYKLSTLAEQ